MANWYSYQAFAQDASTGETIANAQVEVFEAGTSTLATLASDRSGTSKTNPFNADAFGYFQWYAAAGLYDLVISKGGDSQSFTDIALGPAESLDGLPDPAAARSALELNNVRNVNSYSQSEADSRFVNAAGDDMTGALNMSNSDPIQDAGTNALEFDGSGNVTVPNNLTVGGTTTSVNTSNMDVDDPLLKLADGNNSDAIDIGILGERASNNVALFFDESADEWAAAYTTDDGGVTTVSIADYADLHVGTLAADDDVTLAGVSLVGEQRAVNTGDGLTGGGDLSADRTLAVDGTVLRTTSELADLSDVSGTTPTDGQALVWNDTAEEWEPQNQAGGVSGPGSSTDNAVARWDGASGDAVQNSGVTINDNDQLAGHGSQINAQTGTSYTLTAADNGKVITLNNSSAITLTLPENATEALSPGFQCAIVQRGTGQVSVTTQGSDSIESKDSNTSLSGQHSIATVIKLVDGAPNTWGLYGDLTS
jgi:hypothetical protein